MRELSKEVGLLQPLDLRPRRALDMCTSLLQGGQRCYSNTVASLASAEAKYQGVLREWADAALGIARPNNLHVRKLQAQNDLFDARVRHASIPQGEADLSARLDQLAQTGRSHLLGTHGGDLSVTNFCAFVAEVDTDYLECIAAIAEGIRMRERNQTIAFVNVNNDRLTPQQAAELGRYPDASEQHIREAAIARAERQNAGIQALEPVVAA